MKGVGKIFPGVQMRITNAVYQLSEIQRVRAGPRGQSGRARQSALARPADPMPQFESGPKSPTEQPEESLSLPEMLHEHFVEEVRRRDRDEDGRLSLREFGGGREEFESLDRTGKGYVVAKDLTREALARNPELREVIAGPWTPIYESLLHVREPSEENLLNAVRQGAARIPDPMAASADSAGPNMNASPNAHHIAEVSAEFIVNHQDLSELHGRLQTLADRIGRFRRYSPVDLIG